MPAEQFRETHCRIDRAGALRRRDLLRTLAAGSTAATLGLRGGLAAAAPELRRKNKACILLWMDGGPSQLETWDPKPGHANGGETKAIDTAVAGIRIADNLPQLAKQTDKLAIIRSLQTREGEHGRATYLMHTSSLPSGSGALPSLGSVAAHGLAEAACELPAFVRIGERPLTGNAGGFLGSRYDAYVLSEAGRMPDNVRASVDAARLRRRVELTGKLQQASVVTTVARSTDHAQVYESATRMITSPQLEAFDLEREKAAERDAYGRTPFGSACLLARRLVEAGVTFVECSVVGWDTHDNNFVRSRALCEQFDRPAARLLTDLDERGLLDQTLVIWMGEFGRTPKINPRTGRDHYPNAFSAVLAGGGIRGGRVVGATDAGGETIAERQVTEKDLFQTIYKALDVDAEREYMTSIGRPLKFVDGGKAIDELFS
jgi:hypothetical protein